MAVTWDVSSLDATKTVGSLSDVVTTVHWRAVDNETVGSGDSAVVHTGYAYGSVTLAEAASKSFTAYSDITSSTALTWARNALGTDEIASIESMIANQIETKKNPPNYTGIPWS